MMKKLNFLRFSWHANWPIFAMFLSALPTLFAFGLVVRKASPFESPEISVPLFYVTLFFALASSFAFFSASVSKLLTRHFTIITSIRQGIIFSTAGVLIAGFQQFRILFAWNALIIIILAVLIELMFYKADKK